MPKKFLLEQLLLRNNLYTDPQQALRDLMAGNIKIDGQPAHSLKETYQSGCAVAITDYHKKYVSRGGYKLEHALKAFAVEVAGRTALDCGASAGGFTDCLLQNGTARVYAVEAGYGQLAGSLRQDGRVVNLERTNISDLKPSDLDPPPTVGAMDIGYLSLSKAIPIFRGLLEPGRYDLLCLLKPIYETSNLAKRRTGEALTREETDQVIREAADFIHSEGLRLCGVTHSPITGSNGLREYLLHISSHARQLDSNELDEKTNAAITAAFEIDGGEPPSDYTGILV